MGNCALRESFVQKQMYSAVISSHLKRCDVHYVSLMYCVNFCSKVSCCCCNLSNVSGRRVFHRSYDTYLESPPVPLGRGRLYPLVS